MQSCLLKLSEEACVLHVVCVKCEENETHINSVISNILAGGYLLFFLHKGLRPFPLEWEY